MTKRRNPMSESRGRLIAGSGSSIKSQRPGTLGPMLQTWPDAGPIRRGSCYDRQGNPGAAAASPGACREDAMTKVAEPQFIESTAGQVAAELVRRGVAPEQRVTITI